MRVVEILFLVLFSQSVFVSYGPSFFFSRFKLKGPGSRPSHSRSGLKPNYDRVKITNEKTGIFKFLIYQSLSSWNLKQVEQHAVHFNRRACTVSLY